MNTAKMRVGRWPLGVTILQKIPQDRNTKETGIMPIADTIREERLICYGHMQREARGAQSYEDRMDLGSYYVKPV